MLVSEINMEKKDHRGRARGRKDSRSSTDQRVDDIQIECKALHHLTLSDDNAAQTDVESMKSKIEDDKIATAFTAATQQEDSQGELEGLQAFLKKNPENNGVQSEISSAAQVEVTEGDYVPSNLIDAAREFRAHANLDLNRIRLHFFCTICGCPAGRNCWICRKRGHIVCVKCRDELNNLKECLYVVKTGILCNSKLVELKSPLGRNTIFQNTIVTCQYRQNGCRTEGPWKVVRKHQKACPFVEKLTRT